jgi:hypothetical protein
MRGRWVGLLQVACASVVVKLAQRAKLSFWAGWDTTSAVTRVWPATQRFAEATSLDAGKCAGR